MAHDANGTSDLTAVRAEDLDPFAGRNDGFRERQRNGRGRSAENGIRGWVRAEEHGVRPRRSRGESKEESHADDQESAAQSQE
jgi:hypothetical protein